MSYVVTLSNNSNSLQGDDSEECPSTLLNEKFSHFPAHMHKTLRSVLCYGAVIAWTLYDLQKLDAPFEHIFELVYSTSISHRNPRPPPRYNEAVISELKMMLDTGTVTPLVSSRSFPVVIASKSNRFCVDYRTLNRKIKPDKWPLLRVEEVFDDFSGPKWFTSLVLFSGY